MWKRLNNTLGTRQVEQFPGPEYGRYQGTPTYTVEFDEEPPSPSPPIRGPPPPRKPLRKDGKDLPRIPFSFEAGTSKLPVPHASYRSSSNDRPASSLYSQPSPRTAERLPRQPVATPSTISSAEDVSPSESPGYIPSYYRRREDHYEDQQVSPIDEMSDVLSKEYPMSNPLSRAAQTSGLPTRKKGVDSDLGNAKILYDPYTGERTTSEKGKPQSVKPGEFSLPGLKAVPRGGDSKAAAPAVTKNQSFGDRLRKLKPTNTEEKPAWKGGSGRTTLVQSTADRIDLPPLSVPPKDPKRNVVPPAPIQTHGDETTPRADQVSTKKAVPPRNSPQVMEPMPRGADVFPQRQPSSQPAPAPNRFDPDSTIERNFHQALGEAFPPFDEAVAYEEPPSRFSVTTYAPSTLNSPKPSYEIHPVPPVPMAKQSPQALHNATMSSQGKNTPIVNRRRPVEAKPVPPKSLIPSGTNTTIHISLETSIPKRAPDSSKDLPNTPAEAECVTLIAALQARLEDLGNRRNNITRSIRMMTELMPQDTIMLAESVRKRREQEKIKVERLREEEADIRKEEYELGLKLHRAWKRQDRDAEYEPTTLWVRRVRDSS